jgi:hypothetical protein
MQPESTNKHCKNCDYPMSNSHKFCTNCGQKDLEKKLNIKDFVEEFFANFYAFDSKVLTSLRYLITKPGILAKEFVNGKRLKFVNPFRLLLSLAILLGLLMTFSTFIDGLNDTKQIKNKSKQTKQELKEITNVKFNLKIGGAVIAFGDNPKVKDTIWFNKDKKIFYIKNHIPKEIELVNFFNKLELFLRYSEDFPKDTYLDFIAKSSFKNNFKNRYLFERAQILKMNNLGNINAILENYIKSSLPYYLFLCIPFFAILLHLFFYKVGYNFTENLIFTFYLFSNYISSFIIITLLSILIELNDLIQIFILFLIIFYNWIYFYKSLMNFYTQKKSIIRIKFVILSFLMPLVLLLSILLIIIISFLMS